MRASLPDVPKPAVTPIAAAWRPFLALAASVAFVALLSWNVWTFTLPDERSVGLAPEIFRRILRSLEAANHLTIDVASPDQSRSSRGGSPQSATCRRPSPISRPGFPRWSAGGSAISTSGRWRRWSTGIGLHIINLFVSAGGVDEQASTTVALTRNGYNLLHLGNDTRGWPSGPCPMLRPRISASSRSLSGRSLFEALIAAIRSADAECSGDDFGEVVAELVAGADGRRAGVGLCFTSSGL